MDKKARAFFLGVDLHRFKWHVMVMAEEQELFRGTLPGHWETLRRLLDRYRGCSVQVVYEAGYFGFWLHDRVVSYGAHCIVTPPSLVSQEYGNWDSTYPLTLHIVDELETVPLCPNLSISGINMHQI